jgi:DNA invertase Pin-like site-specific DNA recombinase
VGQSRDSDCLEQSNFAVMLHELGGESDTVIVVRESHGGLAEFERHLILARTDEGRKRAQARVVKFGRKLKLTAHQRQEALQRRASGEPLIEIARTFGVSHSTISRLAEA